MKYRITYGDWSGDGHGMTRDEYINVTSDHTVGEMQSAYAINCDKWGASLGTLCQEYEDSIVPNSVVEAMQADGVAVDEFLGNWSGDYYCEDALRLAVAFMSTGLEDFRWEKVSDDAICLTGGYDAKIEKSFGYGLLTH